MKKQLYIFFAAVMFLTRLPIPKWVKHNDAYLQKSTAYFTTVGLLIGVLQAGLYVLLSQVFSVTIAIVLMMGLGILLTGAFHEDGFADSCDAFGGGYTKEKVLEIMKDSRLGTYGVTGLFFMLLTKFLLLVEVSTTALHDSFTIVPLPFIYTFAILIIVGQSMSRFMPLVVIHTSEYVYQQNVSKSKPLASQTLSRGSLLFALIIALVGFVFLPIILLSTVVVMLIASFWCKNYFVKKIGGYTGDCLGATQQITELIFYVSVLVINKIIIF